MPHPITTVSSFSIAAMKVFPQTHLSKILKTCKYTYGEPLYESDTSTDFYFLLYPLHQSLRIGGFPEPLGRGGKSALLERAKAFIFSLTFGLKL